MSIEDPFTSLLISALGSRETKPKVKPERRKLKPDEISGALQKIRNCITIIGVLTPVIISPDKDSQEGATASLLDWYEIHLRAMEVPVASATEFLNEYIDEIVNAYLISKIEAGSAVGPAAVEAFAAPISQSNFNTFHIAGSLIRSSSRMIDNFRQLFEASKSKKTYQVVIKFTKRYTVDEILIDATRNLVRVYASNLMVDPRPISIVSEMFANTSGGPFGSFGSSGSSGTFGKSIPAWFNIFLKVYAGSIPARILDNLNAALRGQENDTSYALYAKLNLNVMYRHKISVSTFIQRVTKHKDCYVVYSPPKIDESGNSVVELYLIPDLEEIKSVKSYEKVKDTISNKDLQLLYFYNTKIPNLSETVIKGIDNIDVIMPRDIPVVNSFYQYELISTSGSKITVGIKYNRKYMIKNSVTDLDVETLLKVLGIAFRPSPSKDYDIIVEYDPGSASPDIIKVNGDVKDKVPFITVGDILRYRLKLISDERKEYIKAQRLKRKEETKTVKVTSFVRLYPDETELEKLSAVRFGESYGNKREKTDPEVAKKEKSTLIKLFKQENIDPYGCYSDDIYEMCGIFGIESCRHVLNRLFTELVKQSDIGINTRHINLICDFMTRSGFITSISERGMAYHHMGPTAQFSYTKPSKYIKKATLHGAEDTLENASSRITVGRKIKSGTSIVDIQADPTKEAQLLKDIRAKKLSFDTSQTATLINQLMNLTTGDAAEGQAIKIPRLEVKVIQPVEIQVNSMAPLLEESILDLADLDPEIGREIVEAATSLSSQPAECRPAIEPEGVVLTIDRIAKTTESVIPEVPYIETEESTRLELSEPKAISVAEAINTELSDII